MASAKEQKELNNLLSIEEGLIDRINAKVKAGHGVDQETIRLQQQKNANTVKLNALMDITESNVKSVGKGFAKLKDDSAETSKLFKSLATGSSELGKNNKFAAAQARASMGFTQAIADNTKLAFKSQKAINSLRSADRYELGASVVLRDKLILSKQAEINLGHNTLAVMSSIGAEQSELASMEASRGSQLMQSLDTYSAENQLAASKLALLQKQDTLSATALQRQQGSIAAQERAVQVLKEEAALLEYQIGARDAAAEAILGPLEGIKGFIEGLPGGGLLSKALGLDTFSAEMKDNVGKSIQVAMAEGPAAGIAHFKMLIGQTKIFGMSLKAAMGPLLVASAIIGALMLFKEMEQVTLDISKNQGVSLKHAQGQHKAAMQAQAMSSNSLANTEEILGAQSALNEAFGNTTSASAEVAMNVSNLSTAFGIAVADAAAVQAQFENMGQSSSEAFQSQALAANLADAAGVAPGKVMKDIASNSKKAARYMGGNVKALTKAAVEAARLGMSLGDMVDISDGLLDIESSITAEFEASVMLGKTINMDKARQLALEGDIAGASKAALEQAGSLADLNAMQPLQRKAIAKAAGMEVGQLMEAAKKQEQLNSLTAEQKKRYEEAGKALEGATLSGEDIVAQQEAAAATKQMGAQFDKIKNTLMSAIMPVVSAITNIFTSVLSPVLDVIGTVFKGMMVALTPVFLIIQGIAKVISTIAPALKVIAGLFGVIYGIKALIWAGDKISLGIQTAKAAFASKEAATATGINLLKKMGLISDQMAGKALLSNSITAKGTALTENQAAMVKRTSLLTQLKTSAIAAKDWVVAKGQLLTQYLFGSAKAQSLGVTIKESAIKMKDWVMDKATLAIQTVRNFLKTGELGTTIAIGAQKALQFVRDTATNVMLGGRFILEQGMLAIQFAINAAKAVGNVIAAGGVAPLVAAAGAAIAAAIPAIFTGLGMVPFGLGIPLAFAAVAGLVGLMASMTTGDDVMSKPSGGSGYGSRTLFGPEGAISFNNKDTIVAGTNLFANDMVQAPKGAIKMNDGIIGGGMGDMPDPPETMIVDYSADAIKKMAVAVGIGTLASGVMLKLIPQMTFSMNPLAMLGGLMGGAALGAAASSGTEGGDGATLDTIAEKLDLLITAIGGASSGDSKSSAPVQIVIGSKVIEEIGSQINVNKSYTISHGSGGEEG